MIEALQPELPTDTLRRESDGTFKGSGFVYGGLGGNLVIEEVKFDVNPEQLLPPFFYTAPIENPSSPFFPPKEFVRDLEARTGYFPLAFVSQVLRPPKHLYKVEDAMFAAVNKGSEQDPQWETRYFPESCIASEIWEKAHTILDACRINN
jgi:hypothetical protein